MKQSRIMTVKIRPDIYTLIEQGKKVWEVRDEDFMLSTVLRYVDSETGVELGFWGVDAYAHFERNMDLVTRYLAGVDKKTFYDLFPKRESDYGECYEVSAGVYKPKPDVLYVAHLVKQLDSPYEWGETETEDLDDEESE
jgi:hypothetical protein